MNFPKLPELRVIHRKAISNRKASFYDENKSLVDFIITEIGKGLRSAATAGEDCFYFCLVERNGLPVYNPVMNREEFETLVHLVQERIEEWDDFDVKVNYDSRQIIVTWT